MRFLSVVLFACFLALVSATSWKETFDNSWSNRWVVSNWKKSEGTNGAWKHTAGEWYGDAEADKGIMTSQDARFYGITAKLPTAINSVGKDLVLQFSAKHTQKIDCGGGYIKLLPSNVDQQTFSGDAAYHIMFGPDICGTTKRVHVIFNYNGKNHLVKREVPAPVDQLTHVYTLIVKKDHSYEVLIDGESKQSGKLEDDWDFLPPRKIKDPNVSKPSDWVDDPLMDDPEDKKPADWDKTPKQIPDPEAEKPEDWDDEADGEWEAPMIDNPEWKGEWKPKRIANPAYKGKWEHPLIDNPEFKDVPELGQYSDIGAVGFELWQVKSGTLFDNILVSTDVDEAKAFLDKTWGANNKKEKEMFDEAEKARTAKEEAERKKAEEERKKAEESAKKDDDDDDDDEEEEKKHDEL